MKLLTDINEIEKYAPTLSSHIKYSSAPFVFLVNEQPTAYGELELSNNEAYVKMLFATEKGQGYGTEFVNYLKGLENVNKIWGEAVETSVEFWTKMGAIFNSSLYKEYESSKKTNEVLDEDFLIPFNIYC